ncbi:MAG: hypothetical protein V1850_00685 [Candidatus Bathyarchaeota archaeon]
MQISIMIERKPIYAAMIDIAGTLLMIAFFFIYPEIGVLIQLACYYITYRYFKEKFWRTFLISVAFMAILFIATIGLFTYVL